MGSTDTKAKKSKTGGFWQGVQSEFRKIIWPDRDTLVRELIAVLAVSIVVGAIIALLDFGFENLINFLITLKV
ncbi:MAG: preprotein translocase subunit SecE [Lachnospiraceae bacterium]|jgi:preprotein translocase subunit SecE|nr:preprotein translocase subunit SecE [Lachnospiraceae bacterium]